MFWALNSAAKLRCAVKHPPEYKEKEIKLTYVIYMHLCLHKFIVGRCIYAKFDDLTLKE